MDSTNTNAEVNEALRTWMTLAESETQQQAAIGAHRRLYGLIESGAIPDWKKYNLTPGAFFGWGLMHVPERKHDGKNAALAVKVADMTKATSSLAAHTAHYRELNDKIAERPSSPPPVLRCPKCRRRMDDESHFKTHRCMPWNETPKPERDEIVRTNRTILQPTPTVVVVEERKAFTNGAEQYGTCVEDLGKIHARLVQGPQEREIRALTNNARRLLDLIDAAATGL